MVTSEDGEDAIEAGDFVDEEREVDELGGCAERDEVEEALWCVVLVCAWEECDMVMTDPWLRESQY